MGSTGTWVEAVGTGGGDIVAVAVSGDGVGDISGMKIWLKLLGQLR